MKTLLLLLSLSQLVVLTYAEEGPEPPFAVLFPWFAQAVGVFVFYLLTRKFTKLPFTAVMFVSGVLMGVGAGRAKLTDQLTWSILQWSRINSEVILLIFLPALIFRDAFDINFYTFGQCLWQILLFAFPMVLAGTVLTAVVAFYVFPYNWSWNLAMTFGSILSATDPVAVAALMNEVGAPPRLKMHIGGESMLNDGSAMVFYTIFSALYLHEISPLLGEDVNGARGVAIFCRMALGGFAVGVAYGLGLILVLKALNRRLNTEENIVQVVATVTVAYLSFYTSEMAASMSGVLAVVFCGITARAFGGNMINNPELMESFWSLVEQLFNTLLFTLAGVIWGGIVSKSDRVVERKGYWEAKDWGYIFLLYVLLTAIRFLLILCFYPVISRIGMKTNWQESVFSAFSGLRGAVGIALSISLDATVRQDTASLGLEDSDKYVEETTKLFGMVGGIAFLTLAINGTAAGPLLTKLGLAKSTDIRARIVGCFQGSLKTRMIDKLLKLLTDVRFSGVDFSIVKHHVSPLADLTLDELKDGVLRHKAQSPAGTYEKPDLSNILPYLSGSESAKEREAVYASLKEEGAIGEGDRPGDDGANPTKADLVDASSLDEETTADALELRIIFIELIRAAYMERVNSGTIDARLADGFLVFSLVNSLDVAADKVSKGAPLCDWDHVQIDFNILHREDIKCRTIIAKNRFCCFKKGPEPKPVQLQELHMKVIRLLAFIYGHREAQRKFKNNIVASDRDLKTAEKLVLQESSAEVEMAEKVLSSIDNKEVKFVLPHIMCLILLNDGAMYVESLLGAGLINNKETTGMLEAIEKDLKLIPVCMLEEHPGEMKSEEKKDMMDQLSGWMKQDVEVGENKGSFDDELIADKIHKDGLRERPPPSFESPLL